MLPPHMEPPRALGLALRRMLPGCPLSVLPGSVRTWSRRAVCTAVCLLPRIPDVCHRPELLAFPMNLLRDCASPTVSYMSGVSHINELAQSENPIVSEKLSW